MWFIADDEQRSIRATWARPQGRAVKPAGRRRGACTGNQPARHPAPSQRASQRDQDVQMWSISGLNHQMAGEPCTITFRQPAPALAPFVSTYYELTIADGLVLEDHLHPEWANIRMALGPTWEMGKDAKGCPIKLDVHAVLHGPTSNTTYMRGTGSSFGIGILPTGWDRLWRLHASDHADRIVPLADALGAETAKDFQSAIRSAPDIDARKAIADAFLIDRINTAKPSRLSSQIDALFHVLTDPANATVDQIASSLGLPQARLARLCKRGFGFPPKLLLRRQRFLRMLGTLHARPYEDWPEFIDPQYVDQSHMIRDFNYFLGMSPSAYFALSRPILAAAAKARAAMFGQPLQGLHLPKKA